MRLYVDIEKKFGEFNFRVKFDTDKSVTGVLGSSGAGKSMTLKCIAGIITPDKGKIVLNGKTLFDSEKGIDIKTRDRNIGYLFQNYALFPNMTVRRNILSGMKNKDENNFNRLITLFRLQGLEDRKPNELSGGQQQRVALARIFATDPEILMLDEPFSALDDNLKEFIQLEMLDILKDFNKPVLLVTHSRDEIFRFCDNMVLIDDGKSKRSASVKEIFAHPIYKSEAKLIGIKNILKCSKLDEKNIIIDAWNIALEVSKNVIDSISHIGIRARDIEILDYKEDNNTIEISIENISTEFNYISMVFKPKLLNDRENFNEDAPYILAKIPRNKWKCEYKNARYIRLGSENIFQLKDN